MTTSTSHGSHKIAEFPDTCVRCTQEWYGIEDTTIVEVNCAADGSYQVVQLTNVELRGSTRSERKDYVRRLR